MMFYLWLWRDRLYDFLSNFYWHFLIISYHFWDIWLQRFYGLTLTFDLQKSADVKSSFAIESPYMTFYLTSIDTCSISYRFWENWVTILWRSHRMAEFDLFKVLSSAIVLFLWWPYVTASPLDWYRQKAGFASPLERATLTRRREPASPLTRPTAQHGGALMKRDIMGAVVFIFL